MSKKLVETLISEGKIQIVDDNHFSFLCSDCGKLSTKSLKSFHSHPKDFNGICRNCNLKKTSLEIYGCDNPMQNENVQKKARKTNLERYGYENPIQNSEVKEKIKETNRIKYGVDNPAKSSIIKEKIKKTNLKKYGCENPMQNTKVKEKLKNSCLEKYGVDNPAKSKGVQKKFEETCLKKYGTKSPLESEEIKEKIKQTNLERYGYDNPTKSKKVQENFKNTCLKKFGVTSPLLNADIQEKIKQTNLQRYGTESYSQTDDFAKTHRSRYCFNGFNFDSSWELSYYIYCIDHDIEIETHPKSIQYFINEEVHYYQPDFLINNDTLIEIKGDHFFNGRNELLNLFDKSEKQQLKDTAKQKCMKENHVLVLRKNDLKPVFEYINETYGKKYLKQYKVKEGEVV